MFTSLALPSRGDSRAALTSRYQPRRPPEGDPEGAWTSVSLSALVRAEGPRARAEHEVLQIDLFLLSESSLKSSSSLQWFSGKFWSLQPECSCVCALGGWPRRQPGAHARAWLRREAHVASVFFVFSSFGFVLRTEESTAPEGRLGIGLQPTVSSRSLTWDAPESQRLAPQHCRPEWLGSGSILGLPLLDPHLTQGQGPDCVGQAGDPSLPWHRGHG